MTVKCVTCTREFKDTHALKSHQQKCWGRATAHARGFDKKANQRNRPGRKLAQHMDVTEEEVGLERQELRDQDASEDLEPVRKQKNQHEVSLTTDSRR